MMENRRRFLLSSFFPALSLYSGAVLALALSLVACTKKGGGQGPQPAAAPQATPTAASQNPQLPSGGGVTETLFRYSLSSVAGEAVFCQDFVSRSQAPLADVESLTDGMALAQAQVPAGVINPFSPKTLGLELKPSPCAAIPEIIRDGHCAVTVARSASSGMLSLQSEQRLLWKDMPVLAQASYIKATIDNKNNAISSKNELFRSVQKQITQQQQFLNILQLGQELATGEKLQLIEQAKEALAGLQNQSKQIELDIKQLEGEIVPIQDELNKTLEKLTTARDSLKQMCNTSGMGATSAEWKNN
ncbi:MAG: hypothetical protein RLZZ488_1144 [Pseudomonadota bacterium]